MSTTAGKPGTAIAVYDRVTDPVVFCEKMAKTFAAVCGVPLEQGEGIALTCLIEGLTPVDYRRRYHTIEGKPSMRADAMLAEFRLNFGGDYKIVERSESRAAIVFTRDGVEFPCEFTWEQAQQSRWPWRNWKRHDDGLKDNWATPTDRKALMWARCISDGLRAFVPELVAGVYTPEEMADAMIETQSIATDNKPAKPLTAAERMQQAAAAKSQEAAAATQALGEGQADGTVAGGGNDAHDQDVVDAEFEPAKSGEAAGGEEPPFDASGAESSTTEAPSTAPADAAPRGTIRADQIARIGELGVKVFGDQKWPTVLTATLAARNVTALKSLNADQGKDLIAKLRDKEKELAAANSPS